MKKIRLFKKSVFRKKPVLVNKKTKIFDEKPRAKPKQKGKPQYHFLLVKSSEQRVREFTTKEEATIEKMKLEERNPQFRYKIKPEKQPPSRGLF